MTESPVFSDQDLSAHLDDEATPELSEAIRAALADDAELRARLEALQAGQAQFAQAMEAALAAAPPMPDVPRAAPARSPHVWPVGLAGVAAGIALALGLGWNVSAPAEPGWRAVVANYQSLYVTETLAEVDLTPEAQAADLERLSSELGLDLTDLPEVDGLSFRRAQQLGFKGKPLAQLTFLTADGGPVALCIIRTNGETTPEITAEVLSGLDAFSWTDNGYGVLLVGPQGDTSLEDAAETFRKALENRPV